jgi:hypothetical protein
MKTEAMAGNGLDLLLTPAVHDISKMHHSLKVEISYLLSDRHKSTDQKYYSRLSNKNLTVYLRLGLNWPHQLHQPH